MNIGMLDETILIIIDEPEASTIEGQKGWGQVRENLTKAAEIPVSVLEQNMNRFLQILGKLFQQTDRQIIAQSDFQLEEVELQVEISGKGEVKLFAGGEVTGKGVITLKLKRLERRSQ